MTTISLVTTDQLLAVAMKPKVASGDVESTRLHVDFDAEWDLFGNRTAVFFTSYNDTVYEVVLVNGECVIPYEVLTKAGTLYIGVRGTNSSAAVKTSTLVKYKIEEGAPLAGGTAMPPTPDIYQQVLDMLANAEDSAESAEQSAQNAERAALAAEESAESAENDANNAMTAANNAVTAANNAVATSNEAKTAATGAQTAASEAKTAATNAVSAANAATTKAAEAEAAASGVTANATAAQNAANAAQTTANAAQTTANSAKTIAEAAKTLANGATKVQTGSYQGTESASVNNTTPTSLTFNFPPKLIFIGGQKENSFFVVGWISPVLGMGVVFGNGGSTANYRKTINKVTISGNTVSWTYAGTDYQGLYEMNWEDHTYHYVAIG